MLNLICQLTRGGEQRQNMLFLWPWLYVHLHMHVCSSADVTVAAHLCMLQRNINFVLYFAHILCICVASTLLKLMSESHWGQLTRCLLQLLPWWSWFGGGWRCSSAPALSAGQVCGNPPWRQNVKFLSTRKVDQLRSSVEFVCFKCVCVRVRGFQCTAPVGVWVCVLCVRTREKERENEREAGFILSDVQTHRCTRTHCTQTHTDSHTRTHTRRRRGGGIQWRELGVAAKNECHSFHWLLCDWDGGGVSQFDVQ